jgi:hypothetical protein
MKTVRVSIASDGSRVEVKAAFITKSGRFAVHRSLFGEPPRAIGPTWRVTATGGGHICLKTSTYREALAAAGVFEVSDLKEWSGESREATVGMTRVREAAISAAQAVR